jgi:two-component system alkaline phosphatase synthesis response regulator PhoP
MQSNVLVVEDEPDIRRGLSINLEREGFHVLSADNGKDALELALDQNPDLVLLDIMLGAESGLDICQELRRRSFRSPIIFLTARSEPIDVVLGLELGADDYVTKPFNVRELTARIRARLRGARELPKTAPGEFRIGSLFVDLTRCHARGDDGRMVEFTAREMGVLRLLIANRNELVTRERMLNEVWGYEEYPTTRTVDMHILKLRQKVEEDPSHPKHILSVYGSGYKFVD